MRDRYDWWNKACDPVLELLAEDWVASTAALTHTIRHRSPDDSAPSNETVRKALKQLEAHGFVEELDVPGGYYVITSRGRTIVNE